MVVDPRMYVKGPSMNIKKFAEGLMIIVLGILAYFGIKSFYVGATVSVLLIVLGLVTCVKSLKKYVEDETPKEFYNAFSPKPTNLLVFAILGVFVIVLSSSISPGRLEFCDGSVDLAQSVMPIFYPFAMIFSRLGFDMRVCGMFVPILAVIHLPYWYVISGCIVYAFRKINPNHHHHHRKRSRKTKAK